MLPNLIFASGFDNAVSPFGWASVGGTSSQLTVSGSHLVAAISAGTSGYVQDNTPMADVGRPEDVAELARFLIGPESRWITGTCINVDGGHHLRRGPDFADLFTPLFGDEVMRGHRPK